MSNQEQKKQNAKSRKSIQKQYAKSRNKETNAKSRKKVSKNNMSNQEIKKQYA